MSESKWIPVRGEPVDVASAAVADAATSWLRGVVLEVDDMIVPAVLVKVRLSDRDLWVRLVELREADAVTRLGAASRLGWDAP